MTPHRTAPNSGLSFRLKKRFLASNSPGFTLDLAFEVKAGFTILFGASGAGKTTVLECLAGLQNPDEGRIVVDGEAVFDSGSRINVPPGRRGIGYLQQSLALFPHMTVEQNIQYGLSALSKAERHNRSQQILSSFHIPELAARRPSEISGGERQRVALARTLVTQPQVLLLDEPLTALDAPVKSRIVEDLRTWNRENAIPILYVTHERSELFGLGETVLVLDNGHLLAQGAPHDVLKTPQSETVAHLAGFENVFSCSVIATHPEQGTMTCRIAESNVDLEVPLTRLDTAKPLRVGIRAGDILVASSAPQGVSARNILPGIIDSLKREDAMVLAKIHSGVTFEAHLTPGAVEQLHLTAGAAVWLVIKTYSCRLLQ